MRLDGMGRVWMLNAVLAVAAAILFLTGTLGHEALASPFRVPWWALAALFYLAEIFVVHIQFQRDAHSVSLGEIPLLLGLFFVSPLTLVFAQVVGDGIALAVHRRQSPVKLAFNLGHFTLETCLAVIVFRTILGAGNPIGPGGWSAGFAAALASSVVGVLMVFAAISLSEGRAKLKLLPQMLGMGSAVTLANTGFALAAITVAWSDAAAAWVLLIPTAVLYIGYRAYTAMIDRHQGLSFLYEAVRTFHRSAQPGQDALLELLSHTREAFKAERAEIVFLPSKDDERPTRTTLGPGRLRSMMVPLDLADANDGVATAIEEARSILIESEVRSDDGRRKDSMVTPIHGQHGVVGALLVGSRLGDVGEFDAKDLELLETLAQHLGVSLDNARLSLLEAEVTQLADLNRMKDDLLASTSHELRTPLTSIQGFVKTLLRSDVEFSEEERRSFLETVARQSDRLGRLVEDLLTASRLENERGMALRVAVLPSELVRRVVDEVSPQTERRSIEVRVDDNLPRVETDGERVHQILVNLLVNATKYSPDGSMITVSAASGPEGLVFSVEDRGWGIPAGLQSKIFDRLYQVDQSSTRAAGGVGLGLYISRKLAETIGGRLWLERSGGAGSLFCLSVPWGPPGRRAPEPADPGESKLSAP
jgi:signal transduction histidine kinase